MSDDKQLRLAAIITCYYPKSHADVIVSRWVEPRPGDADWGWPAQRHGRVVSAYIDQPDHERDMGKQFLADHGIPRFQTVREALTLGSNDLAVDGVLLIGEHGDYPLNELGQKLYPRKELFDRIVEVYRETGQTAPVFCDKHLSWNFDWAQQMHQTAQQMGFVLMGGSSIPHCRWDPPVRFSPGEKLDEVVAAFYGPDEVYGYHSIEYVQAMLERRPGAEPGVAAITAWKGESFWEALKRGAFSVDLLEAALAHSSNTKPGPWRENVERDSNKPMAFQIEHLDGLKVTHVSLNGHLQGWCAAMRICGRQAPLVTEPHVADDPDFYAHFATLSRHIDDMMASRQHPFPPERLLLS
ncbi:MAG TPA: hypothetical protein VF184_00580, partial [Phycisphaeraceae bacterium]